MTGSTAGEGFPITWPIHRSETEKPPRMEGPKATSIPFSESDIVQSILNGEIHRYEEILKRYQIDVQRIAYYILRDYQDAEDLTQDIFIKAYKNLKRYDSQRSFRAWLFTIATRECLSFLRKRKWRDRFLKLFRREFAPRHVPQPSAEKAWELNQIHSEFHQALLKLPNRARLIFILRYVEEWDTVDIAQTLGLSQVTVRRQCQIARTHLKRTLEMKVK